MSEKLARWLPLALLAGLALGSVSPRAGAQLLECNAASVAELASSMAAHNEHVERMERKFVDIWYFQGRLPGKHHWH